MAPAGLMPGGLFPLTAPGGIEAGEGAVGRAAGSRDPPRLRQIVSRDCACRIDRWARKRLTATADIGTCRTRGIERRDCAVGRPQESVIHVVWVRCSHRFL